ncbi:hypothetical protein GMOD_00000476 [Pyrenophora seminiperda CCB06]|uniref:Uncharacterized protein n=1 Tax=Pyrenophora seminiperda CCB06 TaxID=1302712 RepID=A0A3M7M7N8_9PLEO|nr:hypothetical protein GMOD_00000476 [Pyrenophora seminiperda CCB06]
MRCDAGGSRNDSSTLRPCQITLRDRLVGALGPPNHGVASRSAKSRMVAGYSVLHNFLDLCISSCIDQTLCSSSPQQKDSEQQACQKSLLENFLSRKKLLKSPFVVPAGMYSLPMFALFRKWFDLGWTAQHPCAAYIHVAFFFEVGQLKVSEHG